MLDETFAEYQTSVRRYYGNTIFSGSSVIGQVGIPAEALRDLQLNMAVALRTSYEESLLRGVRIGARFAGVPGLNIPPERITERALSWIAGEGANRIAAIQTAVSGDLSTIIADSVRQNLSPGQAATRIGDMAGLTPRQARALDRFEDALRRRRIPEGFEPTERVENSIRRDVERRRRRMMRERGELILETEVQTAVQQGEREFWQEAIDTEQVEAGAVYKRWQTVNDGQVCPICEPLHGVVMPFDDVFVSNGGVVGVRPPAHPRCRCWLEVDATGENFGADDVRR